MLGYSLWRGFASCKSQYLSQELVNYLAGLARFTLNKFWDYDMPKIFHRPDVCTLQKQNIELTISCSGRQQQADRSMTSGLLFHLQTTALVKQKEHVSHSIKCKFSNKGTLSLHPRPCLLSLCTITLLRKIQFSFC